MTQGVALGWLVCAPLVLPGLPLVLTGPVTKPDMRGMSHAYMVLGQDWFIAAGRNGM